MGRPWRSPVTPVKLHRERPLTTVHEMIAFPSGFADKVAVVAGGVDTPMLRRVLERWPEEYERLIPMPRPGQPDEIAGAITFLASATPAASPAICWWSTAASPPPPANPNVDRMFRSAERATTPGRRSAYHPK